jgi:CRISPR-associated protein Cmr2
VARRLAPQEAIYGYGGEALTRDAVNALHSGLLDTQWHRLAVSYDTLIEGRAPAEISVEAFRRTRGFGQMVRLMGVLLRKRKDGASCRPHLEALPQAMRCQACGIRPANAFYKQYTDEDWPLCSVCHRKKPAEVRGRRELRSEQVQSFLSWLEDAPRELAQRYWEPQPQEEIRYAQDLNELGQVCGAETGSRYVGWLYADGNRIGQLLEVLPTPAAYAVFGRALQEALREALYQALAENLRPAQVERESPSNGRAEQVTIHPFEPLVAGGDDVIAMVPGHLAWPVAVRLCQVFEREIQQRVGAQVWRALPPALQHPTLSVGVVIAESHVPVRVLQGLAKELCASAKVRAQEEREHGQPTSALDLLLLKSQGMLRQRLRDLRAMPPYCYQEPGSGSVRRLTAAPYTLAEARRLLLILRRLRIANLANSQLQGLVAALHRGMEYSRVYCLYQMARQDARLPKGHDRRDNPLYELCRQWPVSGHRDLFPWYPVPGGKDREYASVLPDLLELYPLVPRFRGLDARQRRSKLTELWADVLGEAEDGR